MSFFGLGDLALHGLSGGVAGGVAVAGAALLTGLYLLRLRRRKVVVPFAALWTSFGGERRSERLARRLRRWLSLLLQLAMFGLILLAAADPQPAAANRVGRSLVVLVDRSASMSATDEAGGRRVVAARARAQAIVAGLGPADRALVASFAAGVTAESGFESDPARLRRAVDAVLPTEEPGDLGRALDFAAAVLRGRPHPTLVLVSDGAFSEDARRQAVIDPAIDARYVPVGRRARNVGILGFAARRYPADPDSVEAALTVQNFGDAPADVTVEITAGAGHTPVERAHLTLAPGERRRHVLPDVAAPDARLEAELVAARDARDDLELDDRAFAVVPGRRRLRLLRVGPPNLYLDGALLSLGAGVSVRRAPAANVEATRAGWAGFDAVILDGVAPAPAPESGRFLYLDPHGGGSPFAERGVLRDPLIAETRRGHPLLRGLELADVNIAEARRLALAAGDVAVAGSFGAPLVVARERPGLRVAAVAFDVRRSDLPMRTAFPLLVANAVAWLAGGDAHGLGGDGAAPPAATGSVARVPVARGAATVEVRDPAGGRAVWPVAGDVADVPITSTGFYEIASGAIATTIAANLADPVESSTQPAPTLTLGGRALPPPDPPVGRRGRPIAVLALVAAAALLLLEWWSTHRRWTV
jgi:hypothetical protein